MMKSVVLALFLALVLDCQGHPLEDRHYEPYICESFISGAMTTDSTICAMLFDYDGCNGWNLELQEGYMALADVNSKDAESVIVRQGMFLSSLSLLLVIIYRP